MWNADTENAPGCLATGGIEQRSHASAEPIAQLIPIMPQSPAEDIVLNGVIVGGNSERDRLIVAAAIGHLSEFNRDMLATIHRITHRNGYFLVDTVCMLKVPQYPRRIKDAAYICGVKPEGIIMRRVWS